LVTWNEPDRRPVAVVVTTDGRRVNVPVDNEVPLLSLIRSLLVGIESLVLLITGGRDHGGTRRSDRS